MHKVRKCHFKNFKNREPYFSKELLSKFVTLTNLSGKNLQTNFSRLHIL
jgi:hypothetical protein